MQVIDFEITLDGSADPLTAVAVLAAITGNVKELHIEGDVANTHDFQIIGPNGKIMRTVAKYVAGTNRIDAFHQCDERNVIPFNQFSVKGTNTEKVHGYVVLG